MTAVLKRILAQRKIDQNMSQTTCRVRILLAISLSLSPGCLGDEEYISYYILPDGGIVSPDDLPGDDDEGNLTDSGPQADTDTDTTSETDPAADTETATNDEDSDPHSDTDLDSDTESLCNPDDEPTWDGGVDRILQDDCAKCHDREVATYDALRTWLEGGRLMSYIKSGHYISGTEKTIVLRWLEIGAPETDCDVHESAENPFITLRSRLTQ